ncbi:MAG: hypothetical protein GY723_22560 [bacterium]|nr:hypothetical protein [bacterium]MCP5066102.1 hypothetical protein [bacterium]
MSKDPLFEQIREACAEVARRAQYVRIDDQNLDQLAAILSRERPRVPDLDPGRREFGDRDTTLAHVITLNAINFGSGWFPKLRKHAGRSGYLTISHGLRERFEKEGPWTASQLIELRASDCAQTFGQDLEGPAGELMGLFAQALNDLGAFLHREHRARFAGPVEAARGSAAALVEILAQMPLYRDVSIYQGFEVPFYKRAQITCADLHAAFRGKGPGAFRDFDDLTIFADNLVPHTLRMLQVLVLDAALDATIEREEEIRHDGEAEIEIRAVALHAVEQIVASCHRRGWKVNAGYVDNLLWTRGQSPEIKARPRHRSRCTFY